METRKEIYPGWTREELEAAAKATAAELASEFAPLSPEELAAAKEAGAKLSADLKALAKKHGMTAKELIHSWVNGYLEKEEQKTHRN